MIYDGIWQSASHKGSTKYIFMPWQMEELCLVSRLHPRRKQLLDFIRLITSLKNPRWNFGRRKYLNLSLFTLGHGWCGSQLPRWPLNDPCPLVFTSLNSPSPAVPGSVIWPLESHRGDSISPPRLRLGYKRLSLPSWAFSLGLFASGKSAALLSSPTEKPT